MGGRRFQAHKLKWWRPFEILPVGDGRVLEIDRGAKGVHARLRLMPDGIDLAVTASHQPFGETTCRVDLAGRAVETEIALGCLAYFWQELEDDRRSSG